MHPGLMITGMDIKQYLSKNPHFDEVYTRDQANHFAKAGENQGAIFNMDPSWSNKGGTHWTSAYKHNGTYYYMDPFGHPPPKDIEKALKPLVYSDYEYQDPDDATCGFWVIKFIQEMSKNPEGTIKLLGGHSNNGGQSGKGLSSKGKKILAGTLSAGIPLALAGIAGIAGIAAKALSPSSYDPSLVWTRVD